MLPGRVTAVPAQAAGAADAAQRLLRPYLRALWNCEATICELPAGASRPVLVGSALNLPALSVPDPRVVRTLRLASAAHAGAHLAFGGPPFDRGTLKPTQAVLVGLLEDARVEWLACRQFPGLRDLWLGFHRDEAASGNDPESLLSRLAHVLADPARDDPHPWIRKGREFFFAGAPGQRPALDDPLALRYAASLLGNDLGQMRVRFNEKTYAVAPRYRDDNSHLWIDGVGDARQDRASVQMPVEMPEGAGQQAPGDASNVSVYPEWDRLIGCLRRDWVRVHERPLSGPCDPCAVQALRAALGARVALRRGLARAIGSLSRTPAPASGRRMPEGERIHLGALIEARIDQRLRASPDPRVFLVPRDLRLPIAVTILVDASASTARDGGGGGGGGQGGGAVGREGEASVLQRAQLAALMTAQAFEAAGHACAVQAFRSNGRDEVVVHPVKGFDDAAGGAAVLAAAASLEPLWSTRIGAAVRHASRSLSGRRESHRIVLLLTDGEPHDIDIHDPAYLVDDLRMAVDAARRDGVRVVCANLAPDAARARVGGLGRAFRAGGFCEVRRLDALARHLVALLRFATA